MADDYRQRIATALSTRIKQATLPSGPVMPWEVKVFGATEHDLADAVLAVRDQDMETLRADNEELRKRLDAAEAELEAVRAQLGDHGGGTIHFKCVPVTQLAEKISEKRNALAQREEAVARCREALAEAARAQSVIDELAAIVRDLADPEPCEDFDHHGHCQTHGWLQDGVCPHARARDILTAQEAGGNHA